MWKGEMGEGCKQGLAMEGSGRWELGEAIELMADVGTLKLPAARKAASADL